MLEEASIAIEAALCVAGRSSGDIDGGGGWGAGPETGLPELHGALAPSHHSSHPRTPTETSGRLFPLVITLISSLSFYGSSRGLSRYARERERARRASPLSRKDAHRRGDVRRGDAIIASSTMRLSSPRASSPNIDGIFLSLYCQSRHRDTTSSSSSSSVRLNLGPTAGAPHVSDSPHELSSRVCPPERNYARQGCSLVSSSGRKEA